MTFRIVLADDQALVRRGFRMILENEGDIEVVGEAEDGAAAVDTVLRHRPDVALVDIQMPVLDGLEATRRILAAEGGRTRVLILTTFERDDYIFDALRLGASGFITRRVIQEFARTGGPRPPAPELDRLTGRETEVLRLVSAGLSNAEIAARLFVSAATVKTHVSGVLSKLGLRDRVQAVVFAYENRLV